MTKVKSYSQRPGTKTRSDLDENLTKLDVLLKNLMNNGKRFMTIFLIVFNLLENISIKEMMIFMDLRAKENWS
jgi:hypothetical protein